MEKVPKIMSYRLSKGKHCFISRQWLNNFLAKNKYGRDPNNTCVKVFDLIEIRNPADFYNKTWGDRPKEGEPDMSSKLFEATQIQNLCAMYGLAPRVYGLETVKIGYKHYAAQFCKFIDGKKAGSDEEAIAVYNKIKALGEQYHFNNEKDDVSVDDVIAGKLVDFNTFSFTDKGESYKEYVKKSYINDGRYGKVYYQNIKELGLNGGPRQSEDRIKYLALDNLDFEGKNVLDVGCAGGFFTRYARFKNAKRAIGLDTPNTIKAAKHTANYLGFFNIDYFASGEDGNFKMPNEIWGREAFQEFPKFSFDIVFFLSMYMHIGLPQEILTSMTDDGIMIFEKNGRESDYDVEQMLISKFNHVELVGHGKDHGDKPIYHCKGPIR